LIYAIRTGSADYSHHILAKGWVKAGYNSENGMLQKKNKPIPVFEEKDLFDLIGINYVEPNAREVMGVLGLEI
jgi:DNA polymerase/3'-5' exonuclease PolX